MTTPKRPAKKTTRAPRPKSVSKPKAAKPTPARPPKRAVAPPKRTTQADDPVHVRAAADDRGPPPPVVAQIRELEAQLDRLIDEASRRDVSELDDELDEDDADVMAETQEAPVEPRPDPLLYPEVTRDATELLAQRGFAAAPASTSTAYGLGLDRPSTASLGRDEATVFDTARELLSTDFYLRKWGRLAMRGRSEEVDEFGFDPIYEEKARAVLDFLYAKYFRVEATGIERVPARGRCLLIANHSGTFVASAPKRMVSSGAKTRRGGRRFHGFDGRPRARAARGLRRRRRGEGERDGDDEAREGQREQEERASEERERVGFAARRVHAREGVSPAGAAANAPVARRPISARCDGSRRCGGRGRAIWMPKYRIRRSLRRTGCRRSGPRAPKKCGDP